MRASALQKNGALFFVRRFDHEGSKHTKTHEELVTTINAETAGQGFGSMRSRSWDAPHREVDDDPVH